MAEARPVFLPTWLNGQYAALYKTEDFKEGRRAEAEGRQPIYRGN
jgi:enoyl-CoA hydratase